MCSLQTTPTADDRKDYMRIADEAVRRLDEVKLKLVTSEQEVATAKLQLIERDVITAKLTEELLQSNLRLEAAQRAQVGFENFFQAAKPLLDSTSVLSISNHGNDPTVFLDRLRALIAEHGVPLTSDFFLAVFSFASSCLHVPIDQQSTTTRNRALRLLRSSSNMQLLHHKRRLTPPSVCCKAKSTL